ncbi:MAG TPA: NADH-quinone oxidoreductase subunit C [Nitrososphaeraceae archaeon]
MTSKDPPTERSINAQSNNPGTSINTKKVDEPSTITNSEAANAQSSISTSKSSALSTNLEQDIINKIVARYGNNIEVLYVRPSRMKIGVHPQDILNVAGFIKENFGFDHAESVSGTDYPKDNQIEVVYHIGSYTVEDLIPKILALSTRTNRDEPKLPSLISVFRSVEYHERETYEMIGVYFEGHPRMERFLLPEDWADIPPLRKDFRIKGR